jgi:hypothetical protein
MHPAARTRRPVPALIEIAATSLAGLSLLCLAVLGAACA